MLVRFTVENWMSFRDPTTLSMVAGKEQQHGSHLAVIKKYSTRLLPIAAVYGGNASGKTNLFKAINFAKYFITEGARPDTLIPTTPFKLGGKGKEKPSKFIFEILIDNTIYEYSFSVTKKAVLEEKLVQINSSTEKVLYHRKDDQPNFNDSLSDQQFLQFAFQGTRENQLFLTNSVSQNVNTFRPVYDWFKKHLVLVAPDSRFAQFEQFLDEGHPLFATMNDLLPLLDTGIANLGVEEISIENIPPRLTSILEEKLKEGQTLRLMEERNNERFVFTRTRKNGTIVGKKLVTFHDNLDGSQSKFEIRQESDGSQRIIDLLPAFLDLTSANSQKTYIIDEIDRSLHTLLTRRLIEYYLDSCSAETRKQFLFTTHDVLLIDQQLLRRDEMWITERNPSGISSLFSIQDYEGIRKDKDIRKSYLQGRFGGIPNILLS